MEKKQKQKQVNEVKLKQTRISVNDFFFFRNVRFVSRIIFHFILFYFYGIFQTSQQKYRGVSMGSSRANCSEWEWIVTTGCVFNGFNYFYKLLWKYSGKRVVATRYRSRKWRRKESEQASERWCNWIFMQPSTANCWLTALQTDNIWR